MLLVIELYLCIFYIYCQLLLFFDEINNNKKTNFVHLPPSEMFIYVYAPVTLGEIRLVTVFETISIIPYSTKHLMIEITIEIVTN